MESEAFFQEKVYLTPNDISREVTSIDAILLKKIKERLEQKCSPHGYVLPGTLELLTRSAGMVDSGRFSGDWAFLVKAKGRVLHPPEGTSIELEVLKNNKMGVYGIYENAIRVMIPRDLHLGDDEFDQLKVGERIRIEIQKSRFQLRDPFIVSVGLFRGMAAGAAEGPLITNNGRSVLSNMSVREEQKESEGEEEAVEGEVEEGEVEEGAESEGKE
jgi:hypothetical protein